MSDFSMPSEWVLTELGNYIYLKNGFAFKSSDYLESSQTTVPIIRISDIQNNLVTTDSAIHVLPNKLAESFTISKGDLLIAMSGATTGKVGIFNESEIAYQNQRVGNLKLINEELGNKSFRNYLIQSLSKKILDIAYGGAQPNISGKAIEEIMIPLPPKAEQERIAELLDSHLAQVETIKTRLNAIFPILKKFRQSVLADAVSGRLIANWRFDETKSNWKNTNIGHISTVKTGKTPLRKEEKYWQNGDIPWLTSAATGEDFCYKAEEFITETAVKELNLKPFPKGSLMMAMYGEGKTRGQVTELMIDASCNQACAVIQVNEDLALRKFVKLRLKENYDITRKMASGGNQPNLNLNKVREIEINLPPIEEQTEIVARVEQLFTFADTIETQVNNALQRVNQLTQSILHQAFIGQLTADWRANHPELITGDNSAEKLLEQIQKQKATPTKKIKKVKNAT